MTPKTVRQPGTEEKARLCPLYKVILHNDDITSADFVIQVLCKVFRKDFGTAFDIMLAAHEGGCALVEVVPLERGEFHIEQATSLARARHYPLTFTMEAA
jgi:ATP-dependent Clp protease adaptor protein ClpS